MPSRDGVAEEMKMVRVHTTSGWYRAEEGWSVDKYHYRSDELLDGLSGIILSKGNLYHYFPIEQILEIVFVKES